MEEESTYIFRIQCQHPLQQIKGMAIKTVKKETVSDSTTVQGPINQTSSQ